MKQFFTLIRFKSGKKCQKWVSGGFKTDLLKPYTCTEGMVNFCSFIKSAETFAGLHLTGLTKCERRLNCNSERQQYQSGDRQLPGLNILSNRQLTAVRNWGRNLHYSSGTQHIQSGDRLLTGSSLLKDRQLTAVRNCGRNLLYSSGTQQIKSGDRRLTGFSLLNERQLTAVINRESQRSFHCSSVIQQNQDYDNDERHEDDEAEKDQDFFKDADELLKDDQEYNECVRYYCNIPGAGHRIYLIQPVIRPTIQQSKTNASLMLEESCALVSSLPNWYVVAKEQKRLTDPRYKTVFRKGQLQMLSENIRNTPGVSAIFLSLDVLSQVQLNYLQNLWGLPVFDRYTLVLQIFKDHAKSREAKLQVALAEIPFVRSRIEEKHLNANERSGRTGGVHMPHHIADKYRYLLARTAFLQNREAKLRETVSKLKKQRTVNRQNRLKRKIPTVAVIGYTNAGKTTLIKALTGDKDMMPENRLFATLDVTAHGGLLPCKMKAVYMDTVGFISNIPYTLYNAFAATLEDAVCADLVVHVRDLSHPDTTYQRMNVLETVKTMLSEEQIDSMIEVCNKMDKLEQPVPEEDSSCFYISSVTGEGLEDLRDEIQNRLLRNMGYLVKKIRVPLSGPHLNWLYKEATVTGTENDSDFESIIVHVIIGQETYAKFGARFGPNKRKEAEVYR